jgi:ubiquinone biosynthesis protein
VAVFTVAGFGHAFKQMGLEAAAERTGKILVCKHGEEMAHLDRPHRVRRVLEILGPTFIKLGQILAPRPDLFGQEWIAEFERLQAQAPPVDFETLRRQIEKDLGAPLDETRNALQHQPLKRGR